MKIGVVGSRRRDSWEDYEKVRKRVLKLFRNGDMLVSGGCPKGADFFAEKIARKIGCPILIYHANWDIGKHAGFLRNTDIAKDSDVLVACVAEDRTGGTEDTIKKFQKFHPTADIYLC